MAKAEVNKVSEAPVSVESAAKVPSPVTSNEDRPGVQSAIQALVDNTIPYSRFKEIVGEKNALQEQLGQYRQVLEQLQEQQSSAPAGTPSTVDELMAQVNAQVSKALDSAYKSKVAPLEQYLQDQSFNSVVENYFSSSPEKAALRNEMNAYTSNMAPEEVQFIKKAVTNGNTRWLDNIYYAVASQRQANAQQMANQNASYQANMAVSPTPYKTMATMPMSKKEVLNQAKETGDWTNVFGSMVPPSQG